MDSVALWPWWAGGASLALVALGYWRAFGRLLGVSGSVERVVLAQETRRNDLAADAMEKNAAAMEAAMLEETRKAFPDMPAPAAPTAGGLAGRQPLRLTLSSHALLLVGIVLGGFIGALARGSFALTFSFGAEFERLIARGLWAVPVLLGGGVLVGFGTAMSGACTTGHGLCGTSRLQRGSVIATAVFFGTGIAVSLLLEAVRS